MALPKRRLGKTGFQVSPIGFGSYRISATDPLHQEALTLALRSGCNLIDTSTNYSDGEAETLIGRILEIIPPHERPVVVTKAGYAQGRNLALAQARIEQGKPFPEMVKFAHDGWHCISPEFLETQITLSLSRLKLPSIDVFLLHNPEYFLKAGGSHAEYYDRIERAFQYLETEVVRGRIRWYGVSSNTFPEPMESPLFTSLSVLLERAQKISVQHHFAVIQCPFNLFEPGAWLEKNNDGSSLLELAQAADLGILTNRPLNAFHGSELLRLAYSSSPDIPLEEAEDTLRAALNDLMQLESAYPGEQQVPSREVAWGHALHKSLPSLASLENWKTLLERRIRPSLATAFKKLESDPSLTPWLDEYRFRSEETFSAITGYLGGQQNVRARAISGALKQSTPASNAAFSKIPALSSQAISLYLSVPGIHCILLGMRHPSYVRDALSQLISPLELSTEELRLAFEEVQQLDFN